MVAVLGPGAVPVHLDEALEADLADAGGHAARLHRLAAALWVLSLDPRVAGDAFLRDPGVAPIHDLFIGARLHTLAVAPAPFLVDKDDAVLGALVDRLARAGRQAAGIGAVVADACQIEKPGLVLGELYACLVELKWFSRGTDRVVLINVGRVPLLVSGQVAEDPRAAGREHPLGLKDRLPIKLAVRSLAIVRDPS